MKSKYYLELNQKRRDLAVDNTFDFDNSSYPNCFGTALFLTGEIKVDDHCYEKLPFILSKLERIPAPILGCLILFESDKGPYHMGVVVNTNPLLMAHRKGDMGEFHPKQSLDDALRMYGEDFDGNKGRIKFYLPKLLGVESGK